MVVTEGARLAFGDRVLWENLDLTVRAGEFVAVLGPNGTGKTSLLKVLLGEIPLSAGSVEVTGGIGYVPQHRSMDAGLTLRGRDLVGLGYDGHRWGVTSPRQRAAKRDTVTRALRQVDGIRLGDVPVGVMSGGELQRVRIAQAIATEPAVLLCDEPLLNLDPANARLVSALIDQRRRESGTAVLFVTHEVNPVLPYVDRVLYLADGRFRIGTVAEVMTSETLSDLYRADIHVVKIGGQYVVVGDHGETPGDHSGHASGHRRD